MPAAVSEEQTPESFAWLWVVVHKCATTPLNLATPLTIHAPPQLQQRKDDSIMRRTQHGKSAKTCPMLSPRNLEAVSTTSWTKNQALYMLGVFAFTGCKKDSEAP